MRPILAAPAAILVRPARDPLPRGAELAALIDELEATMRAARGIGIAAPQIGLGLPIALLAPADLPRPIVLLAPHILEARGSQIKREGCLSLPAWTAMVERPTEIRVRSERPEGGRIELVLRDELARIASHEIDHLDGQLYIGRADPATLQRSGR